MKSMILRPAIIATLTLGAALGLAGCSSYDSGYGYSRVSLGYGSAYRPYYGWYDGYYYPGTGYYIYDRSGSRYRWSDRYRNYWESRRPSRGYRDNWSEYRRERRDDRREWRQERREDSREWRRDRPRGSPGMAAGPARGSPRQAALPPLAETTSRRPVDGGGSLRRSRSG